MLVREIIVVYSKNNIFKENTSILFKSTYPPVT